MLTIEKAVPAIAPTIPRIRIATFIATVKAHGNPRNGGLSVQKVSISIRGGKMKARAQLATAPMRLMRPSRSGRPNARPAGQEEVCTPLERCPHFRGWYVQASMELGPEDVSLLERCPHFRGWYVQASMELGPEDVSLLERCPHFRGWYVQASMELGPEDVSLLEVSSFQRVVCTGFNGVGT